MKKARLPLPVMILLSTILFLVSSTLGEWIGGPSSSLRTPASETVEQQQAALLYLRVMSWFSRAIVHPSARAEDKVEPTQPAEPIPSPPHGVAVHTLQTCALSKPSRSSTRLRKFSCGTLSRPRPPEGSKAIPSAVGELRDLSVPASGSLLAIRRERTPSESRQWGNRCYHCTRTRYFSTDSALAATGTVKRAAKAAVFSYL